MRNSHDVCPGCGGKKRTVAKLCRGCRFNVGDTRSCTQCHRELPVSAFRIRTRATPKPRSHCKECEAEGQRVRFAQKDPQTRKATTRAWERANPERYGLQKLRRRFTIVGADKADIPVLVDRYLATSACEACGRSIMECGVLHIDHCHRTGRIRGFICGGCNTGIRQMGDDPERLMAASRYLLDTSSRPGARSAGQSSTDTSDSRRGAPAGTPTAPA